ncbi:DNA replication complex GINS protein psf1 [Penicillium rolfsii]|nr:DNA replication complex GINS protein psf1 [Penicillium rolfsii]
MHGIRPEQIKTSKSTPDIMEPRISQTQIPVVDFAGWASGGSSRRRVAHEMVAACKKVGFVYIINHSVPDTLLDEAFHWSRLFFELPAAEKLRAPHPDGWAVHRGYSWPGLEKVSQAESYDIGSEENLAQPNQWIPEHTLPGFRAFMNRFYWEGFRAGSEILRALAVGLDLDDENYLLQKHSGHNNQLRLLHYPPVPADALEQHRAARCPAHTDWSSITLLLQDDCGGLEVEDVQNPGQFIPVAPIKNAIVMNVGDLLQRWSNDQLISTSHRVTLPPLADRIEGQDRITRRRFSIPYFMAPDPDSVIECIPACTNSEEPAKYEPITQAGYNQMRASMHRVPPSHIDPDRVATMYGELGNKLVQHAKRTQALAHLPPYQTEIVRAVTREVRDLDRDVTRLLEPFEGSFNPSADPATACALLVDHLCMRRNKRCLMAYHRVRTEKLEELCWTGVDVLEQQQPSEVGEDRAVAQAGSGGHSSLSPEEEEYFRQYGDMLAAYKGQWTDIDLTGTLEPPKDLFIDVRVLKDAGEIQTEYGVINLTKNSQLYVRQGDVERLIAQGFLERLS